MRRLFFSLAAACMCCSAYCQIKERVDRPLPRFGPVLSSLTTAKGWVFNEDKRWVSRPNRIPVTTTSLGGKLVDFENNGLGYDNFYSFSFRKLFYGSDTVLLLTKKFKDGDYLYEAINEGWFTYTNCTYWTFKLHAFDSLNLKKDTTATMYIPCLSVASTDDLAGRSELTIIQKQYNPEPIKGYSPSFRIDYQVDTKRNIVRFLLYTNYINTEWAYNYFKVVKKEYPVFKYELENCYFETSLSNFKKFMSLTNKN